MSKDSHSALLKQLKDPFDPKLVKWTNKGGKSPTQLAYIDARDVMKRLDDVLGIENYQTRMIPVDGGFVCELSIRVGDEWITRSDGASNTKIEPIKGGISDALKRAGNAWGIGRYLYYLPKWANRENVEKWPKWALPGENIENWEDIAEMEAEAGTGMDEEETPGAGVDAAIQIRDAESLEALKEVVDGLDAKSQITLTDAIANKTDELTRGE
jgi:hypothetical protein